MTKESNCYALRITNASSDDMKCSYFVMDRTQIGTIYLQPAAPGSEFIVKREANKVIMLDTAQRAIAKLGNLKIFYEVSKAKRGRAYCAKAILESLEEPALLTPSGEF